MLMLKAYAKINLALKILGKDDKDGYHYVDMVTLPIELHDRIEMELLPDNYDSIITCDDKSLPTDESNIVYKTLKLIRDTYNVNKKVRIHIHKEIPMCAGLGGGSADGAVVLVGLNKLFKLHLSMDELCTLGAKIGSDVPLCLKCMPARVTSKGERIEKIKVKKSFFCLLVKPDVGLSTKDVYKKYDETDFNRKFDVDELIEGLAHDDIEKIECNMGNDLEDPAFELSKEVEKLKNLLVASKLPLSMMTGSGSCVYALSHDYKKLEKINEELKSFGYKTFLTKTL